MGKRKLAAVLGQSLGMSVFNVGEFAKENNCLGNWDPEYESHELDEDPLLDLLGRVMVALFWSTIYQICFLRDGLTWSWPSSAAIPCCMTA